MLSYGADGIKMTAILDDTQHVEHLYFQCFGTEARVVSSFEALATNGAQVFVP